MRICPYVTPREPDSDGAMVTSARSAGGSSISEAVPQDAKSDTTLDCKSTIHHPMSIGTRYSMSRRVQGVVTELGTESQIVDMMSIAVLSMSRSASRNELTTSLCRL